MQITRIINSERDVDKKCLFLLVREITNDLHVRFESPRTSVIHHLCTPFCIGPPPSIPNFTPESFVHRFVHSNSSKHGLRKFEKSTIHKLLHLSSTGSSAFPTGLWTAPSTGLVADRQTEGSPLSHGERATERDGQPGGFPSNSARPKPFAATSRIRPGARGQGRSHSRAAGRDHRRNQAAAHALTTGIRVGGRP